MKYTVVFEPTTNGYSAYAPDLPGCVAAAGTREHVKDLIRGAIAAHVELLREYGEAVPPPKVWSATIEVT